jgi:hypothetical protein
LGDKRFKKHIEKVTVQKVGLPKRGRPSGIIQNAENTPPNTTIAVAKRCIVGGTRFQPKIMIPRNPASVAKASTVSKPRILPMKFPWRWRTGPVGAECELH